MAAVVQWSTAVFTFQYIYPCQTRNRRSCRFLVLVEHAGQSVADPCGAVSGEKHARHGIGDGLFATRAQDHVVKCPDMESSIGLSKE
jgi:hypothetical protein